MKLTKKEHDKIVQSILIAYEKAYRRGYQHGELGVPINNKHKNEDTCDWRFNDRFDMKAIKERIEVETFYDFNFHNFLDAFKKKTFIEMFDASRIRITDPLPPHPIDTYQSFEWVIEDDGALWHKERDYYIDADRLLADNWFIHLAEKEIFDMPDFLMIWAKAVKKLGHKTFTVRVRY